MQREIEEMKEQENGSLWHDSPHQNSGQNRRTPKENFFVGNGISQFTDPDSLLSTLNRVANCTIATKVQASLSPKVQQLWKL
jgi:hypothetical protein